MAIDEKKLSEILKAMDDNFVLLLHFLTDEVLTGTQTKELIKRLNEDKENKAPSVDEIKKTLKGFTKNKLDDPEQ